MKIGSLFSGIGGFELGFQREGFEVAWSVEIDPHCRRVLHKHFPKAKIYSDICEVQPHELEAVDIVCGGFPCQDLSFAGKRKGLAGERSGLFHEAMRLVRGINPRVLILENVPGLLSSHEGRDFGSLLSEMDEGWDCKEIAWRVLDSRFFGVPQRRRRVFVVGSSGIGCAEQILALSEGLHERVGTSTPQAGSLGASRDRSPRRGTPLPDPVNLFGEAPQSGLAYAVRTAFTGANGHGIAEEVSHTLDLSNGQAVAKGNRIRRFTPVECERLQGFPDGWTDGQPDPLRYKQLGNAVTVNVIQWLAANTRRALQA